MSAVDQAQGVPRIKREWHYAMPPATFEVAACRCGNADLQWSEFVDHVWCDRCSLDFTPEHYGLLDGPIAVQLATLLGIRFDRIDLATGQIDRYDVEAGRYASAGLTD